MQIGLFALTASSALSLVRAAARGSSKLDPAPRVDEWALYERDVAATRALHPAPAVEGPAARPVRRRVVRIVSAEPGV